jgi:ketosteroid isomerase-like protein
MDRDWTAMPDRRALFALAALPLAIASEASAAPGDLADAVSAHDRATIAKDIDTLGRIVAEDYTLVNSDGSVQGKASYLADFRVPGFQIEPYGIVDPFHRAWGDAALTGGTLPLSWFQGGENHVRTLRVAHVWTRDDGRWRLRYSQLTRVPG